MMRPPRLAERLLAFSVRDRAWRDSIVGDLHEEFVTMQRQRGAAGARRWYWRQACAIGARAIAARVAHGRSSSWVATADVHESSAWGAGMIRDLQYAWRGATRQPTTSAVIVITLALTLATNSTSLAVFDALVLRPFRFPDVDRVVVVASSNPQEDLFDRQSVSPADFSDWRREAKTVTALSAAEWWDANLSGVEQPEQVPAFKVTADFFEALRAQPPIGRDFVADEEIAGNHRRVVLGHGLWTRLFAADPGVVGRSIRVDGERFEVVGVAPPGFAIPEGAQLWAPLAYSGEQWADRRGRFLIAIGRLRDGATLADARAEIGAIAERQRRAFPETNADLPNAVVTFTEGMQDAGARAFIGLIVLASVLLLLIACANIANLLLARGSERAQEFGVRVAMGGSRARLVRQLLLEAGLLTGVAVLLAMPLAGAGLAITRASIPVSVIRFIPGWAYLHVSPTVFLVTAGLGAAAVVIFALVPAFHTVRADVAVALRQSGRTVTPGRQRYWVRNALAASQVALTLILLFASGLMLSGVDRAVNSAMGFDKRGLLLARVVLPEQPYAEAERRRQFADGVIARVQSIPAVASAAVVSNLPYSGGNTSRRFYPEGVTLRESDARFVDYRRATLGYFETMRIPLRAGRALTASDREGNAPVAVVSQVLADRYWPEGDAVGRRFRLAADGEWITVVGIVGDVLHDWFQQRRAPTVYRPIAQDAPFGQAIVVRTVGDPLSVAGDLRRAVGALDPDQPIMALQTMEQLIDDRTAGLTYIARMIAVVAAIALVLALMGLYSLMAYLVSRRTQELGVRLALGATRWQILALATRRGLYITLAGVLVGAVVSALTGRLMESALFGLIAVNAWHLPAFVVFVAVVSAVASYLPARRTARLDPTAALRAE
jgi:putative ABC transport system permease protein